MIVPCIVKNCAKAPASTKAESGVASWARISMASTPPTRKKKKAVKRNIRPRSEWFTLLVQPFQPGSEAQIACSLR